MPRQRQISDHIFVRLDIEPEEWFEYDVETLLTRKWFPKGTTPRDEYYEAFGCHEYAEETGKSHVHVIVYDVKEHKARESIRARINALGLSESHYSAPWVDNIQSSEKYVAKGDKHIGEPPYIILNTRKVDRTNLDRSWWEYRKTFEETFRKQQKEYKDVFEEAYAKCVANGYKGVDDIMETILRTYIRRGNMAPDSRSLAKYTETILLRQQYREDGKSWEYQYQKEKIKMAKQFMNYVPKTIIQD